MVKSKKDLVTPRRRASFTKNRGIVKALSRPTSAVTATSEANIKVIVRVRPPNNRENAENFRNVVKVVDDQMLVFDPKEDDQPFFYHGVQQRNRDFLKKANKNLQFVFDRVFSNVSTNDEVFECSTQSLIKALMNGYNCSVFAYGATGAGKTFTMIGTEESPGITFLTMAELFRTKNELCDERDFNIGITYIEVYNELVKDLLNPGAPLQLREDSKYGVVIAGIKFHEIHSPDELFKLLAQGNKHRTQHPTDANSESSRSHAVFQVYLQMTMKGTGETRSAKLSMIDLAGSERGSATGFNGARFVEGANINKSLLALGNCINSLADGLRHVPYRDSKLTRLLKDSLGGNCQTVMIANVSPSSLSFEDTYNTLKYATRAKKIKSHMKKNIVNVEMHVGQYVKLVEELQDENKRLKTKVTELTRQNDLLMKKDAQHVVKDVENIRKDSVNIKKDAENTKPISCPTIYENIVLVEENLKEQLATLIREKKDIIEREYQLQSTEVGMDLRRQLKQERDKRLSGIFTNNPNLREAHRKIHDQVDRFQKKSAAVKTQLERITLSKTSVNDKISELVRDNPQLKLIADLEEAKLQCVEAQNKAELEKKLKDLLLDDHKEKCSLLEKMALLLKPCYMQILGHRLAPAALVKQYQDLVADFVGRRNITWDADVVDSGVSSCTSLTADENQDSVASCDSTKVIFDNKENTTTDSQTTLDSTFSIKSPPPSTSCLKSAPTTGKAQLLGKVHKSPLPGKKNTKSPLVKRLDNARNIIGMKTKGVPMNGGVKSGQKSVVASRPPFRS